MYRVKKISNHFIFLLLIVLFLSQSTVFAMGTFYFSDSPLLMEQTDEKNYSNISVDSLGTDNLYDAEAVDYTQVFVAKSPGASITYTLGNIEEMTIEAYCVGKTTLSKEKVLAELNFSSGTKSIYNLEFNEEKTVAKAAVGVKGIKADNIVIAMSQNIRITQIDITYKQKEEKLDTLEEQKIKEAEQQEDKQQEEKKEKKESSQKSDAKKAAKKESTTSKTKKQTQTKSSTTSKKSTAVETKPKAEPESEEAPESGNFFVEKKNRWVYIIGFVVCVLVAMYLTKLYLEFRKKEKKGEHSPEK